MAQPTTAYYEGQEFHNPSDPSAPVLVYTKRQGFITKDQFNAQRGGDQVSFDRAVSMLDRLAKAKKLAEPWDATGFMGRIEAGDAGGWFKGIGGTAGYNLDRMLTPVRANNFVKSLTQMRQNSPTGAAVGNPTEKEGAKVESQDAILDTGQSKEQLLGEIAAMEKALRSRQAGVAPEVPIDLSGGETRAQIPRGAYYRDPQGNIRRNDNGDAGNPIIKAAPKAARPVPQGVDPNIWAHMTPQEQALWN